jgi:hypothetical protein
MDNYVEQLEKLIVKELLPVYEKYNYEHGLTNTNNIPENLLQNIKRKQQIPALLKPKQI